MSHGFIVYKGVPGVFIKIEFRPDYNFSVTGKNNLKKKKICYWQL